MYKKYDNEKEKRSPGGVIMFPPIPPWIIPKPPWPGPHPGPFPPIPPAPSPKEETKLNVKIKSVYENDFVAVGKNGYLYATEDKYSKNEFFKLIIKGNNVKIRYKEGNFVRLDNKNFLIADTDKKDATTFKLYKVDREEYVLLAPNGYYVRVREKDNLLVAKAEQPGERTRFKFKIIE